MTWSYFKNKRKRKIPCKCFLDLLGDRDTFAAINIENYYPGLRQKFDRTSTYPSYAGPKNAPTSLKIELSVTLITLLLKMKLWVVHIFL